MAKKFGKFLLFTAAATTAVAGAYYYLKKKNEATEGDSEDFDDFDDFSEDLDDEDTAKADCEKTAAKAEDRSYVDLALDKAKDSLDDVKKDAVEKTEEFFDDEDHSVDAQ